MKVLEKIKEEFSDLVIENGFSKYEIKIQARGLSSEEAIGNPKRDDFPLIIGDEVMIQAQFKDSLGQAFTDHPGNFQGSLSKILDLSFDSNYHRALFIASVNAVLRSLSAADKTVHCKDEEPHKCAKEMAEWISNNTDAVQIGIVGYQPAIVEECSHIFGSDNIMVTDLNPTVIGEIKAGVEIWDGSRDTESLIKNSDVVLATGSSIINNTIDQIIRLVKKYEKEYYFFGNTIAGPAALLDLPRLCFYGH
ncbi:Rossmann-like domain-containing protein [Acetohalobium arabaticum]|uniref:Putative heavy-metal chelation domain-containing protein n=1 Tax=Acetohalobium arabaticum (strain ATCC 49924 / DSM 5501 / Z-7288) TaxID=574087 RepID=D9QUV9_ACEAZ|nr:DUF364 domain-containing protein [Acetohalobium arabaticum]ADL12018.1 conserved hypothetical protein [Acetohalobium arabaticum DSM 5501]